MTKCEICKNAIFNELWGSYKCKVRNTSVPKDSRERNTCTSYKKGKPKVVKRDDIYEDC